MIQISRVELGDMVGPSRGDAVENVLGYIPMRIDQINPVAPLDVLEEEIAKQGGLA